MRRAAECRDRARTPMPWDASPTAGFTAEGVRPWLPLGDNAERNVAGQRDDPASTLRFCRDLLALRRAETGGTIAAYTQLPAPPGSGRTGWAAWWSRPTSPGSRLHGRAGRPAALSTDRARPARSRPGRYPLGPWEGVIVRGGAVT